MGHVTHNAIIVTTWDPEAATAAQRQAHTLHLPTTALLRSSVNRYFTLLVGPSGSKRGWPDDDTAGRQRDNFVSWLRTQRHEDSSSPYEWVSVEYGSDDWDTTSTLPTVTNSEWHDQLGST